MRHFRKSSVSTRQGNDSVFSTITSPCRCRRGQVARKLFAKCSSLCAGAQMNGAQVAVEQEMFEALAAPAVEQVIHLPSLSLGVQMRWRHTSAGHRAGGGGGGGSSESSLGPNPMPTAVMVVCITYTNKHFGG